MKNFRYMVLLIPLVNPIALRMSAIGFTEMAVRISSCMGVYILDKQKLPFLCPRHKMAEGQR